MDILIIVYGLFFVGAIIEPIVIPVKLIHDKNHSYNPYLGFNILFIIYTTFGLIYQEYSLFSWSFLVVSILVLLITSLLHYLFKNLLINI